MTSPPSISILTSEGGGGPRRVEKRVGVDCFHNDAPGVVPPAPRRPLHFPHPAGGVEEERRGAAFVRDGGGDDGHSALDAIQSQVGAQSLEVRRGRGAAAAPLPPRR